MRDASCLERTVRKLRADDLSIRFRPERGCGRFAGMIFHLPSVVRLFHPRNIDKKEKSTAFWSFQSARSRGSVIQEL